MVETTSSAISPPVTELVLLPEKGERRRTAIVAAEIDPSVALPDTVFEEIPVPGGVGALQVIRPAGFDPAKKYPVIVYVYGGPQAPVVEDSWPSRERGLWNWMMAERGYLVVLFDDRTSSRTGHRYETPIVGKFGFTALPDHRALVENLRARPYVDGAHIGIWGWSGGGYSTVFDMAHAPDLFRAGVAVAGLFRFEDYDSVWSERYMGLPAENAGAYAASSALSKLEDLRAPLLVAHGSGDDNVHFQNAEQILDRLVALGKPHDVVLFPGRTHGLSRESRRYLYAAMTRFFDRELRGECR